MTPALSRFAKVVDSWTATFVSERAAREVVVRAAREITADWQLTDAEAVRAAGDLLLRELAGKG